MAHPRYHRKPLANFAAQLVPRKATFEIDKPLVKALVAEVISHLALPSHQRSYLMVVVHALFAFALRIPILVEKQSVHVIFVCEYMLERLVGAEELAHTSVSVFKSVPVQSCGDFASESLMVQEIFRTHRIFDRADSPVFVKGFRVYANEFNLFEFV